MFSFNFSISSSLILEFFLSINFKTIALSGVLITLDICPIFKFETILLNVDDKASLLIHPNSLLFGELVELNFVLHFQNQNFEYVFLIVQSYFHQTHYFLIEFQF